MAKTTKTTKSRKSAEGSEALLLTDHEFYAHTSWHCGSDKKLRAKLRDLLSEFAFTEGGHFNPNKMCVTFREVQLNRILTVYGSIDESGHQADWVIHYQAVVEYSHPRKFRAGNIDRTIKGAITSINL